MKLLIFNLPKTIDGGNKKDSVHHKRNRNLETKTALLKRKYITFNTEERTSILIFDFDYIDGKNATDVFTLEEFVNFVYLTIDVVPTYVCQTDKGFQFGFHLQNHVYSHQEKALNYVKAIKIAITKKLGCDKMASHRLHGVWRNPLKHKFHFSGIVEYELKQFTHLLEKKKKKASIPSLVISSDNKSFNWPEIPTSALVQGQRHHKLFLMAITFANQVESLTVEHLASYLQKQNSFAKPPLDDKEVMAMVNYVYAKKRAGKLYLSTRHAKDVDLGIMQFEKMRNLTLEEYQAETKRRQSLSAARTNEIKREKNKKEIVSKIQKAIKTLKAMDKNVTILGIAKLSGLSRNTIKSHWNKNNL